MEIGTKSQLARSFALGHKMIICVLLEINLDDYKMTSVTFLGRHI